MSIDGTALAARAFDLELGSGLNIPHFNIVIQKHYVASLDLDVAGLDHL